MISRHHCVDPRYSTVSIAARIYFLQAAIIDVGTSRSSAYSIRKVTVGVRFKSLDALLQIPHVGMSGGHWRVFHRSAVALAVPPDIPMPVYNRIPVPALEHLTTTYT